MKYRVIFYCPDTHIQYDGRTPYRRGVGGGITARIRMARALSRAGHQVQMVVNCLRKARIDGVEYIPLSEAKHLAGDVLILNTSGGALDLSPLLELDVKVGLRAVWTSGTIKPGGLEHVGYDFVYAKSNFLRGIALESWTVPQSKVFVAYNGFEEADFAHAERRKPKRDPWRLVYFSHPSKGLDTAMDILCRLRAADSRFHLFVYGGPQLWGQEEQTLPSAEGVFYHGLIGQKELARNLMTCAYSINLQARLEPFGMVITESMRAGCIVLASPVGAYQELIRDGEDGYLIQEDHTSEVARSQAAELILQLHRQPDIVSYLQRNGCKVIWDTDTMVRIWEGHWRWWFEGEEPAGNRSGECPLCRGNQLWLADGYHCIQCGYYARGRTSACLQE
jgi:glycosyltransferase involved in cell wall biosynthesis